MKKKDIVAALNGEADRCEEIGIQQFKRSAERVSEIGYTEFNNSRIWGERAQGFRRAAHFVGKLKGE